MAATIAGLTRLRFSQNVSTIKFVLCRHPRLHLQGVLNPVKLTEILFYVEDGNDIWRKLADEVALGEHKVATVDNIDRVNRRN